MMPSPGELIAGKYRIDRKLAEGGMGVIYEGLHIQLDERVAIKFLRDDIPALAHADAVQRFVREARASIKIRSEHVVRILDVSAADARTPYMVMELLEGQDLDQRLEHGGALPPLEAVDFVLQACEALAEAHQRGIIHRDLKPANLFLTTRADGSSCIKLLDFGISKVSGAGADLGITSTQAVMGSPRYMSPEQLRTSKSVDARSDVWAIGIVLYELLVGEPPFDGESMTEVIAAILQDAPASLAGRKGIPPGLEAVILCALEKSPDKRFSSIRELAAALRPFASPLGAASAARALGTTVIASSSDHLVVSDRPTSAPDLTPASAETKHPAVGGMTSTAWGDLGPKPRARGFVALAIVLAAALLLVGAWVYDTSTKRSSPAAESATRSDTAAHANPPPPSAESAAAASEPAVSLTNPSPPTPTTSAPFLLPKHVAGPHGAPPPTRAILSSALPPVAAPSPSSSPSATPLWDGRK